MPFLGALGQLEARPGPTNLPHEPTFFSAAGASRAAATWHGSQTSAQKCSRTPTHYRWTSEGRDSCASHSRASGAQGVDLQLLPQEGNESGCVCWPRHTSSKARTHTGPSQTAASGGQPTVSPQDRTSDRHIPPPWPSPVSCHSGHSGGGMNSGMAPLSTLHGKVSPVTTHSTRSMLQTRKLSPKVALGQERTQSLGLGNSRETKSPAGLGAKRML